MKKLGAKTAFSAWCGLIALSALSTLVGLLFAGAMLLGCVDVDQQPTTLSRTESAAAPVAQALRVDSAAIYRCDTCAFARAYLKQISGQVKACKSCPWTTITRSKHDKGDVPEPGNPPVDALAEQDAAQHGTEKILAAKAEASPADTTPTKPAEKPPGGDQLAHRRKPIDAPVAEEGDGI